MFSSKNKLFVSLIAIFVIAAFLTPPAYSAELKIGYVDLRKAFYEYEKAKKMETELNALNENSQNKRKVLVEAITKIRDESELLSGDAKTKKQSEIDAKLAELKEFDRDLRQELLTKKNDMFREVVDDIQATVKDLGKKAGYDYIFDYRNIMYSKETFDLTDQVLEVLNKE